MIKKIHFFVPLIIALSMTSCNNHKIASVNSHSCTTSDTQQMFNLGDYEYYSASVLPTITQDGELYAILSREAYGTKYKLGKWHKYDDFSGSRDKGETHPIMTAAHEFLQEAILELALGWNLAQTTSFIKPENNNTWAVIAYSKDKNACEEHSRTIRNVTYITHFDDYKDMLFNNFHEARKKEMERYNKEGTPKHHRTNVEKDMLAKVKWSDLKAAICAEQNPTNEIVTVEALVMNPKTKRFRQETIQLRPFLVIKLRPYFLGNGYAQGEDEKIRLYQD
jgi:hypothetical protein